MSVIVEPQGQISFAPPLPLSEAVLSIKNTSAERVTFKVKTTAPKQYCVRPNSGFIDPSSSVEVKVILQPFKEELPKDFKCRDKFLVLSAAVNTEYSKMGVDEIWDAFDNPLQPHVDQKKLKCVYLPAQNTSTSADTTEPVPSGQDLESSNHSVESAVTVQKADDVVTETTTKGDSVYSAATTLAPVTAAASETTDQQGPDEANELRQQLEAERKKIKDLKEQLSSLGTAESNNKTAGSVHPATVMETSTVGYPPQVLLLVAFVVFIVTYKLF